ncbi:hypothetical protein PSHT_11618 [Puccinia striiformis]|uniref:Uncharacterized protein n=1 Tax=Puccinia striiformis TaxID=27350 RepID=A0A2S4V2A2_9BASI|nr:hypothetical protein PSHT_11618 [Puccinia striiformis]
MANDLQAYLASKYMSGPKAEAILASRIDVSSNETNSHQEPGSHSGMILKDVDGDDQWISRDDELDDAPGESFHTAEHEFQSQVLSRNRSNIIVVQTAALSQAKWKSINDEIDNEPDYKTAALEQAKLKSRDNEIDDEPSNSNKVVDGGLQTAASIRAKLATSKAPLPPTQQSSEEDEPIEEETIYRDSQGKKIDTKQLRAKEKRKQARELEKKMKKMEWGKGLVQRQDRKTDADELKKIASQPFSRTIDDKEMNDEMKGTQRWNDPAAGFLTKPESTTRKQANLSKRATSTTQ